MLSARRRSFQPEFVPEIPAPVSEVQHHVVPEGELQLTHAPQVRLSLSYLLCGWKRDHISGAICRRRQCVDSMVVNHNIAALTGARSGRDIPSDRRAMATTQRDRGRVRERDQCSVTHRHTV